MVASLAFAINAERSSGLTAIQSGFGNPGPVLSHSLASSPFLLFLTISRPTISVPFFLFGVDDEDDAHRRK